MADSWPWTSTSATLFDKPLLGALIIFAAALLTSWNMWRMLKPWRDRTACRGRCSPGLQYGGSGRFSMPCRA
ncbi:hypothetical protein LP419_22530 [Massilia sp. H-1]|nr:hypothetical protein LP419_22530 [Massilia sp. H-1]